MRVSPLYVDVILGPSIVKIFSLFTILGPYVLYLGQVMAVCKWALCRSVTLWLVSSLIFNSIYRNPLNLDDKRLGICLEGFVVAKALCVPFLSLPRVQMRIKSSAIVPASASHKLLLGSKLLNVALFTNILVLCNDVATNPGPIDVT